LKAALKKVKAKLIREKKPILKTLLAFFAPFVDFESFWFIRSNPTGYFGGIFWSLVSQVVFLFKLSFH
jgi:hypothetical protein